MSALCPRCNHHSKVVGSRPDKDGVIRRRRECLACRHKWSTYEVTDEVFTPGMVLVPDTDIATLMNVSERIRKRMQP